MAKPTRCAIYTRKSTEEGLEQSFNSLDAQREACATYIVSQRHEGWSEVGEHYDDGGFSGGTMERPGLVRLMADVAAGKVDVIVVYKVDRLTRALSDFARIVDILDKAGACFVSVTQAFNTTTSMGRLTLNVLLSFAQFEREVTGERIRDKIAASKAKGMWMGGVVPLGYAVVERKLIADDADAEIVRHIMNRYLELGSVVALADDLATRGVFTKRRSLRDGGFSGGTPFTRGALFHLLSNRIYVGEIRHKDRIYPGEHAAIVERPLWEAVQMALADKAPARARRANVQHPSLLAGLAYDGHGRAMQPSHAIKNARRYRYYVTRNVEKGQPAAWRVPAHDFEQLIIARLCRHYAETGKDPVSLEDHDEQLRSASAIIATLRDAPDHLRAALIAERVERIDLDRERIEIRMRVADPDEPPVLLDVAATLVRSGRQTRLAPSGVHLTAARPDEALVRLVAIAHAARKAAADCDAIPFADLAEAKGFTPHYFAQLVRLGGLAPDIITAILEGRQPAALTRTKLARTNTLPLDWAEQRRLLGFARP